MTDAPAPEPRAPQPEATREVVHAPRRATEQGRVRRAVLQVAQAHLRVGSVDDPAEREADVVATQVVDLLRSPTPRPLISTATPPDDGTPARLQRSPARVPAYAGSSGGPPAARLAPLTPVAHRCGPACLHRHPGHGPGQHHDDELSRRIRAAGIRPARVAQRSPLPTPAPRLQLGTRISHRCGPACMHRHAGHHEHDHDHDAAGGPDGGELGVQLTSRIQRMAGRGAPLGEPIRRSMEDAFGADFSGVRIHADSDIAPQIGAEAFTAGNDIHFAPGTYRPADRQGQWLLGHELTHVVQQQGTGLDGLHRHAEGSCIMRHASKEHYLLGTLTPDQIKHVADDKASADHGDTHDANDPITEEDGLHTVQQQLKALEKWKSASPDNPDPSKVSKGGTDYDDEYGGQLLTLTCKNGEQLVCTVGEMNALPDFIGAFEDIAEMDRRIIFRTLQVIRRESFIYLKSLEAHLQGHEAYKYDAKTDGFQGLEGNNISVTNALLFKGANDLADMVETDEMLAGKHKSQKGTGEVGLGVERGGDATLGRNACHFPPESWLRWREYHTQARTLIAQSSTLDQLNANANKAIGMNAFGEHYLQDSFASGHLINKGWVMAHAQKYMSRATKWKRSSEDYRAMMEQATKHEAAYDLPQAAQNRLDVESTGVKDTGNQVLDDPTMKARDPQSALDEARKLKPTDHAPNTREKNAGKKKEIEASGFDPSQITFEQYRTWLSDMWLQKITNTLHDMYCVQGLTVKSPDNSTAFKIYGDSHMMESSEGAQYTAATSMLSRSAINNLVDNKRREITMREALRQGGQEPQLDPIKDVPPVEAIIARFPNTVVVGGTDMKLVDWATGTQMEKKIEQIADATFSLESLISIASTVKPVAAGLTSDHGPF